MVGFSTKIFAVYDDYMTPKSAWEAITDYIPKDKVIWEPFYGNGDSGRFLREIGCGNVIHEPEDFFENNKGDIVVSNPPFSMKKEVLERLVQLQKPFILIMPSSTISYKYTRDILKDDIQIIIPKRRIQFLKLENGTLDQVGRCNFDCFYFCYKIGLPRDIIYLN
jgi:hypothetical protein